MKMCGCVFLFMNSSFANSKFLVWHNVVFLRRRQAKGGAAGVLGKIMTNKLIASNKVTYFDVDNGNCTSCISELARLKSEVVLPRTFLK